MAPLHKPRCECLLTLASQRPTKQTTRCFGAAGGAAAPSYAGYADGSDFVPNAMPGVVREPPLEEHLAQVGGVFSSVHSCVHFAMPGVAQELGFMSRP
eukprot:1161623-Pelagomonas_calceolata.AAC.17